MAKSTTLVKFYNEIKTDIPQGLNKEIGHFNVFKTDLIMKEKARNKPYMPYNRRAYYKISLINGRNRAEYADKIIDIDKNALLFATPRIPYNWIPKDDEQSGYFCIFTDEFLARSKSGVIIDDLPIFHPGGYPVFELTESDVPAVNAIFEKMYNDIQSDYPYKYDLLRLHVLELIHYGQRLQPFSSDSYPVKNASTRVTSLFIELLERQFPVDTPHQRLGLRTAKDFADRLAVHVNHLNKVLKESTGNTTTTLINNRILQEAKILLRQTDWSISDISFSLGYEEIAHFSNFFKRHTSLTPMNFRSY